MSDASVSGTTGAAVEPKPSVLPGSVPPGPVAPGPVAPGSVAPGSVAPGSAHSLAHDLAQSLLSAESRRDPGAVDIDWLTSSDRSVRRLATRAVARMASFEKRDRLELALVDEDPEVVAWGAFGIGALCRSPEADATALSRVLAIRSARLGGPEAAELRTDFAIARALGRCATEEAERSLVAWLGLGGERARSASLALGDVARQRRGLGEAAQAALVSAAAGTSKLTPVGEALYPFCHLDRVAPSIENSLVEVARHRLLEPAPTRIFAIRAMTRVARHTETDLQRVLAADSGFDAVERVEAVRALERLGSRGREAIGGALRKLVPVLARPPFADLVTASLGALMAAVEALAQHPESVSRSQARAPLFALTQIAAPEDAKPTLVRRIVRLRCAAATALVEGAAEDPLLRACDPDPQGEVFELSQLRVLDRREFAGRRLSRWRELLGSAHVRVRTAALMLIGQHPEIDDASDILASALEGVDANLLVAACLVIAAHPERVLGGRNRSEKGPNTTHVAGLSPRLEQALASALARSFATRAETSLVCLAEAAAAVGMKAAQTPLLSLCRSSQPWLRDRAARALSWLPGPKVACSAGDPGPAPEELGRLVTDPATVHLAFELGELTVRIDPTHAPIAATRFVQLVRSGWFDATTVQRAVPGLLVQLGERPVGGGGAPEGVPLPLEAAPVELHPLDLAISAFEPDASPPRFFVALSRQPQFDAEYSIVGKADGDWVSLTEGDQLLSAWVE